MQQHSFMRTRRARPAHARHNNFDLLDAASQQAQLMRLAEEIAAMPRDQFRQWVRANPALFHEWQKAFRNEEVQARELARFWRDTADRLTSIIDQRG